jgi:phosphate starvation-inducible protein PhoH and related proteins
LRPERGHSDERVTQLIFDDNETLRHICGDEDRNLKIVEEAFGVRIGQRGNKLSFSGPVRQLDLAEKVVLDTYQLAKKGHAVTETDFQQAVRMISADKTVDIDTVFLEALPLSSKNNRIAPKSIHQREYIEAIRSNDLVFGIGPAGTGKTYLAMAMAVAALLSKRVSRIVLTRPAVEAGEKLGYLPGDMTEKVNPYLRPLYDALHDMMSFEKVGKMLERGQIEVAPLAFMRGRTLNDSFVILDEAQNTTPEQMKMFLTRLGYNSKAVVTGDVTQVDLPRERGSGLADAVAILQDAKGIPFIHFSEVDVVRHPLVQQIIIAYERHEKSRRPSAR